MTDKDPNLVVSGLSGTQSRDGVVVEVNIFRLETDAQWSLEVVNANGLGWRLLPSRAKATNFTRFQTIARVLVVNSAYWPSFPHTFGNRQFGGNQSYPRYDRPYEFLRMVKGLVLYIVYDISVEYISIDQPLMAG